MSLHIEKELQEVLEIERPEGSSDQEYYQLLIEKADHLSEETWEFLTVETKCWLRQAYSATEAEENIKGFLEYRPPFDSLNLGDKLYINDRNGDSYSGKLTNLSRESVTILAEFKTALQVHKRMVSSLKVKRKRRMSDRQKLEEESHISENVLEVYRRVIKDPSITLEDAIKDLPRGASRPLQAEYHTIHKILEMYTREIE